MPLQERPGIIIKKLEELKDWQRQQQEKLLREQESQRDLLSQEQRRLFQEYGLENRGIDTMDPRRMDTKQVQSTRDHPPLLSNRDPLKYLSLEISPPSRHKESPPFSQISTANHHTNEITLEKNFVPFDEIPLPSPGKNFDQLLHDKLDRKNQDDPVKGKSTGITKKPFLKKGQGLVRYNSKAKNSIPAKCTVRNHLQKSEPPSKPSVGTSNVNGFHNDVTSIGRGRSIGLDIHNSSLDFLTNGNYSPESPPQYVDATMPSREITKQSQPIATWSHVLSNPEKSAQPTTILEHASQQQRNRAEHLPWQNGKPEQSTLCTNKHQDTGSVKLNKGELDELRIFELLEQKAANSSFCSTASTIARLFDKSIQSTPNKNSFYKQRMKDFEYSPVKTPQSSMSEMERSLHVRFAESNDIRNYERSLQESEEDTTLHEDSTFHEDSTLHEDTVEYMEELEILHDQNLAEGNDTRAEDQSIQYVDTYSRNRHKFDTLKDVQSKPNHFHDDEVWSDSGSCLSSNHDEESKSGSSDESSVLACGGPSQRVATNEESAISIETRSRETETKMLHEASKFDSPRPSMTSLDFSRTDIYNSDLLRKRLEELENEIKIFRKENANLVKVKRDHELQVSIFMKEKKKSEKLFREERENLANMLDIERKKLAKEKLVFEKYCKDLKNQPTKQERDEIIALKLRVESLKEDLLQKDSRWSATQVRTRNRVKQLENENAELRSQVHKLKSERQELRNSQSNFQNSVKSTKSLETKVMHAINNHISTINPRELKKTVIIKDVSPRNPIPKSVFTNSSLANRPIWGARNVKLQRTKSVPDMRRSNSLVEDRKVKARHSNGVPVKPTRFSDDESESDHLESEDPIIDKNVEERLDTLRKTVYETFYNNIPNLRQDSNEEPSKVLFTKRPVEETAKDSQLTVQPTAIELDEEPEYLKILSKKMALSSEIKLPKLPVNNSEISYVGLPYRSTSNGNSLDTIPNGSYEEDIRTSHKKNPFIEISSSVNKLSVNNSEKHRPAYSGNSSDTIPKDIYKEDRIRSTSTGLRRSKSPSEKVDDSTASSGLDSNKVKETIKANGSREKVYGDGRCEIWYSNGNVKKITADRSVVKMIYYNGDVKETIAKDGVVKYYYAETKTWHSTYADGLELLEFPNGQVERRTANGVTEITYPNGSVRVNYPDGRDEWVYPDGTRVKVNTTGEKVVQMPNGQREIHTREHKRREYPDGTVKLVYPDGLQETRYANGRIRLKDKDGNLVMDSNDAL